MQHKSYATKLAKLRSDPDCGEFILTDAKDADMAMGLAAPGRNRPPAAREFRSLAAYRDNMREITRLGLVDLMLMSPSTAELLAIEEGLFDSSPVTPAVRANDTTDIWLGESGGYAQEPSLGFRTATIAELQYGSQPASGTPRVNLGLYSITLNNDAGLDRDTLERYREFRHDASTVGFHHFLEVFAPNAPVRPIVDVARFLGDSIVRLLAGIPRNARPQFLKMPYLSPAALENLRNYDPSLIIGILGGPGGTTFDAFHLIQQAKKYGARAALFGRKINQAEDQLAFIRLLRKVADEKLDAAEATRAYHSELQSQGIASVRSLPDDLVATQVFD